MKTASYTANGGPIIACVTCTPKCDGSYALMLWERGQNKIVSQWRGNFVNDDDDCYSLDPPNTQHDGRHFECIVTVSVPAGLGPATVALSVKQDGRVLAADSGQVPPDSPGGMVDLFVALKQA
jgi:hypothetical protein